MAAHCGDCFMFYPVFYLMNVFSVLLSVVIALLLKRELVVLLFVGLQLVKYLSTFTYSSIWCHWKAIFCDCDSFWTLL